MPLRFKDTLTILFSLLITMLLTLPVFTGCAAPISSDSNNLIQQVPSENALSAGAASDSAAVPTPSDESAVADGVSETDSPLTITFLDVGQADCIFIRDDQDHELLIDAGNNGDEDLLYSFLAGMGDDPIDYVLATHPHEDHIGSMDMVLQKFDVSTFIMSKSANASDDYAHIMTELDHRSMSPTYVKAGDTFQLGNAAFTILSAETDGSDDLNDSSLVVKLIYGENSFLFMGDATSTVEKKLLASRQDLSADLIKIGHHGSSYSTTAKFLYSVDPDHAVISVGSGNTYGHPDQLIVDRLKTYGVKTYRTDLDGTVDAYSDGETIRIDTFNASDDDVILDDVILDAVVLDDASASAPSTPENPKSQLALTLSYAASLSYNNHVGNNWTYLLSVDGKVAAPGDTLTVSEGQTLVFRLSATENDSSPDHAEQSFSISYQDLLSAPVFSLTNELTVEENRGRYSGERAGVTFNITLTRQ